MSADIALLAIGAIALALAITLGGFVDKKPEMVLAPVAVASLVALLTSIVLLFLSLFASLTVVQ